MKCDNNLPRSQVIDITSIKVPELSSFAVDFDGGAKVGKLKAAGDMPKETLGEADGCQHLSS